MLKFDDVIAEPKAAGRVLHNRTRNISDIISERYLQTFEDTAVLEKSWSRTEKKKKVRKKVRGKNASPENASLPNEARAWDGLRKMCVRR